MRHEHRIVGGRLSSLEGERRFEGVNIDALEISAQQGQFSASGQVDWAPELRSRKPEALEQAHKDHRQDIHFQVFCQFLFLPVTQ